jgi:hypothetical protein
VSDVDELGNPPGNNAYALDHACSPPGDEVNLDYSASRPGLGKIEAQLQRILAIDLESIVLERNQPGLTVYLLACSEEGCKVSLWIQNPSCSSLTAAAGPTIDLKYATT